MQFEEEKATLPFILFLCFTLKEALIVRYISRHPAYFSAGVLASPLWTLGILI